MTDHIGEGDGDGNVNVNVIFFYSYAQSIYVINGPGTSGEKYRRRKAGREEGRKVGEKS